MPLEGPLEYPPSDALLNHGCGVPQRLDDCLALERFDGERRRLRRHNDECHNRHLAAGILQAMVQPSQRLDEHVDTLVSELITTSSEDVQGIVRVKVIVAIEVTANKVVNLLLGLLVQVLEFMDGGKFGYVEPVGQDTIGLSLQQMLRLECCNVRHGRKYVARVCGCALDTVSMVDAPLAGFGVDVEVLQVVIKVDRAGAKISSEESGMRREDGGDVNATLLGQRQGNTGEPFVEVSNDGSLLFVADKLQIPSISLVKLTLSSANRRAL